jgi:hypothetical protein
LKKALEEDVVRRERQLGQKKKLLEQAREQMEEWTAQRRMLIEEEYSVANKFASEVKRKAKEERDELEERDRELTIKENGIRTRKTQRSDYHSYQKIWRSVHTLERDSANKLKTIALLIHREHKKLIDNLSKQGSDSDPAVTDQMQVTIEKLKELETGLNAYRDDLNGVDKELQQLGHDSRHETRGLRFEDTRLAANSMATALYIRSINPLRSIKALTQQEIDEIEVEIQNASNATTSEELQYQKEALAAQKVTVSGAVELAYLDQKIQTFETLQHEPYVHKAAHLATFDLRLQVDRLNAQSFNSDNPDVKSPELWSSIRDSLAAADATAKKTAMALELKGEHEEHERKLDAMIAEKIASFTYQLQAKRAQLFNHHKSARAAAKRAPVRTVRVWGAASSSSTVANSSESAVPSLTMPPGTWKANSHEMAELRRLLNDPTVSLDPESRARKAHRYNELNLQNTEYEIEALSKRLISSPRKRSESERNHSLMKSLERLRARRSKAQYDLRSGVVPGPRPVRKDDATTDPEAFNQQNAEFKLKTLKAEVVSQEQAGEFAGIQDLKKEVAALTARIKHAHMQNTIRNKAALGEVTRENAKQHERLDAELKKKFDPPQTRRQRLQNERNKASKSSDSRQLDDLMAAWSFNDSSLDDVSTTEPTVASDSPGSAGLNMTPTSAKQATHQPTGRRDLHDHVLWADFLRRQESRESSGLSSFTTASITENGTGIGSGDVSAVPSADCATADATPNASEAARDYADAAKNDLQAPASLSTNTSTNDTTDTENTMAESDEDFVPTYEISSSDKKNALIASRNSTASFWRYSLYKNAAGNMPTRHYCTTFEQTEAQIAKFLGEKVVGFDLEWEKFKSRPGEDSAKRCVSLMQIAAEGKVALFHLAMFKGGDSTEELIPPSLRAFLEDPKIIKVGVNIGGDATRLRNCFGIEMQGNIELSHLYKLVTYGESNPEKVNRGLYALASQVKEVLHLPLAKGAVRTSSWSKRLNDQQTEYAVSDAYAGLRLYYELERRRKAMVSKPPRPEFHELGMPILLGGGELPPTKGRRTKQPVDVPEEVVEEAAALQEQDDGEASEDSDDIYDTAEDLEAFDAYVESQDAHTVTGASLPEITYPTLPSLNDLLSGESDSNDDSSLPSDPITKTSTSRRTPTPNLHTPEAVAADSWATAWQAQLPATSTVRVSQPHLRAYHLWHHQGFDLKEIPALLRKEPLALSTVVSYIAEVLQKEDLEFDVVKVRELRARLPASVRGRYAKLYANDGKDGA